MSLLAHSQRNRTEDVLEPLRTVEQSRLHSDGTNDIPHDIDQHRTTKERTVPGPRQRVNDREESPT